MTGGVYIITNLHTNMKYVGMTQNFDQREKEHGYALRKGKHANAAMQNDFTLHGMKNFKLEIIVENEELEERKELERSIIRQFNCSELYNVNEISIKQSLNDDELANEMKDAVEKLYNDTCLSKEEVSEEDLEKLINMYLGKYVADKEKAILPFGLSKIELRVAEVCKNKETVTLRVLGQLMRGKSKEEIRQAIKSLIEKEFIEEIKTAKSFTYKIKGEQ